MRLIRKQLVKRSIDMISEIAGRENKQVGGWAGGQRRQARREAGRKSKLACGRARRGGTGAPTRSGSAHATPCCGRRLAACIPTRHPSAAGLRGVLGGGGGGGARARARARRPETNSQSFQTTIKQSPIVPNTKINQGPHSFADRFPTAAAGLRGLLGGVWALRQAGLHRGRGGRVWGLLPLRVRRAPVRRGATCWSWSCSSGSSRHSSSGAQQQAGGGSFRPCCRCLQLCTKRSNCVVVTSRI